MDTTTFTTAATERHQRDLNHIHWQADIEAWQEDYDEAVENLQRLTELVKRHGEAIESHRATIEQSAAGSPMPADRITGTYASQLEQRGEHSRLESKHRVLMAHLVMLKSAIEASS